MRDHGELRKVGRGRRNERVRKAALIHAQIVEREAPRNPRRAVRTTAGHNWRIKLLDNGSVLALEPGREYENIFEGGPDPFWEAVEFAAAELRKEQVDADADAQSA